MRKRLGAFLMVCTLAVGMVGCGNKETDKSDTNTTKDVAAGVDSEEDSKSGSEEKEDVKNIDYSGYTADVPREERDIDYYWNINTATFDKTKFDGRISVFGTIVDGKLTGKSLNDAGFTFVTTWSKDGDADELIELNYNMEEEYGQGKCLLYINDKVYPSYNLNVAAYLYNYDGGRELYADNTELYFYQPTVMQDKDNLVIPYMENVDYSALTIDDIIDHLGAPTYVECRGSALESTDEFLGGLSFNYFYVYDDYTFKFNFLYYDNTGISVTNIEYMGSARYARPVWAYSWEKDESVWYDSYEAFLERQQQAYLEAIGAK